MPKPAQTEPAPAQEEVVLPLPLPVTTLKSPEDSEEKTLVTSGR
uniref:Thioredoxin-like 7 family protein n=1 Tax=Rhizophora mucronata TaxID=61149 RepID=A0A2P2MCY3_RHIMU